MSVALVPTHDSPDEIRKAALDAITHGVWLMSALSTVAKYPGVFSGVDRKDIAARLKTLSEALAVLT